MLLHKPFFERGQGQILPQCDGPFVIAKISSPHTVVLADPHSGDLYLNGRPQSVTRIVRFDFPVEYATNELVGLKAPEEVVLSLKLGDFVAVAPKTSQYHRIHVGRVERTYPEQQLAEVALYHVPSSYRFGPWENRHWELWTDSSGALKRETVTSSEVICLVNLVEGALSQESLEKLTAAGIPTGRMPGRDHTLPPRGT